MFRYTCKIIIRRDRRRSDGKCPLCMQAFINGKKAVVALNIYAAPEWFDEREQILKYPAKVSRELKRTIDDMNMIIDREKARFSDITTRSRLSGIGLSVDGFKEQFKNDVSTSDFVQYVRVRIEKLKADRAQATVTGYNTFLLHLTEFRSRILFYEINHSLLEEYDRFLRHTLKLNKGSTWKHLKDFRKFLNEAIRDGIKCEYPFKTFKFRYSAPEAKFLTRDEVLALMKIPADELTEKQVLSWRMFMFAVFTGIRISDVCELDNSMLVGNELVFIPRKTNKLKKQIRIPVSEFAVQFIQHRVGRMFDRYSKPHINMDLKVIATKAEPPIQKHLTFHMARHTFATLSLEGGGRVEVLQELLGHANLATTMIYAHITNESRKQSIDQLTDFVVGRLNRK